MSLPAIVEFLQRELRIVELPDYSGAVNGLQVQNSGKVTKVAAAVDGSWPVIKKAIAAGADLLVVHHGLFWQGAQPLTGAFYEKIKCALDADLAIYSAHLPLDVHPKWGNNALLAQAIGMQVTGAFLPYKGMPVGLLGEVDLTREELTAKLEHAVGGKIHLCPGGPQQIRRIGLCTGGAGSEIAAAAGLDAFITGEGPHWSYPMAEEMGVNLFYAGHYATETFGVKALAQEISQRWQIEQCFIDHPTGL